MAGESDPSRVSLSLRPAVEGDCELLFSWANDPEARRMSFSPDLIGWEEHQRWFERKLDDENCLLYIVTGPKGEPVGQVRFDIEAEREAVISVSIAPEWRGYGCGGDAIRLATIAAKRLARLAAIHAYIKPENVASTGAFAKAGFGAPVRVTYRGAAALRMSVTLTSCLRRRSGGRGQRS